MSDTNTNILNQGLVSTAKTMFKEGFITEEQYTYFVQNYFIVAWKPNTAWDKLRKALFSRGGENEQDKLYYDVVKLTQTDDYEDDLELRRLRKYRQNQLKEQSAAGETVDKKSRFSDLDL